MTFSQLAAEPSSFLGQPVGNRLSLIHMSALIQADAPPPHPWLLHTFPLLWQSLISLDLDGRKPKLPLTPDNRPPPSVSIASAV